MKIDSNYKIFTPYVQNFSQQNADKNLISPPYKIELSEQTKKIFANASGEENISTLKTNFVGEKNISEIKEDFRQELVQSIQDRISEVLKPYETYEDAYENLYAKETTGWWSSFDEENISIKTSPKISGVHGAFGILANSLNNYLDQFGADDGYFDSLLKNLEKIDTNDDAIVGQIKNMISTVRGGNFIDIQSSEFEKNIGNAITNAYSSVEITKQEEKNSEKNIEPEQKSLSNFETLMQKAKEDEQILDKFLGKESKNNTKSVGEIISENQTEEVDAEFENNLKNLDKPSDENNFAEQVEVEQEENFVRKIDEETISSRKNILENWLEIVEN